jgi:hypothetical protein
LPAETKKRGVQALDGGLNAPNGGGEPAEPLLELRAAGFKVSYVHGSYLYVRVTK